MYHSNKVLLDFIDVVHPTNGNCKLFMIWSVSCLISYDWKPASFTYICKQLTKSASHYCNNFIYNLNSSLQSSISWIKLCTFYLLMTTNCHALSQWEFDTRNNVTLFSDWAFVACDVSCSVTLGVCKPFNFRCASLWHSLSWWHSNAFFQLLNPSNINASCRA